MTGRDCEGGGFLGRWQCYDLFCLLVTWVLRFQKFELHTYDMYAFLHVYYILKKFKNKI